MTDRTTLDSKLVYGLVVPYVYECGDWEYHVSDELKNKLSFTDVFKYSNLEKINQKKDRIELWFETTATVSERVAKKTHHQPASYENHEVRVFRSIMAWPETGFDPNFDIDCRIEQEERPCTPPSPNI